MIDFTSALYLGFEHASWSLPGWPRLTLGKPGALEALPDAGQVEQHLAALTGSEQVALGTSTLHLFCDLFAMFARRNVAIHLDEATYPIARWATDRAAAAGVPVRTFPAHDTAALSRALRTARGRIPVVVTDGYCPWRGRPAPLGDYADCLAKPGGLLIVDDTQALGVLGRPAGRGVPYGLGGGGSMQRSGLGGPRIVIVSSLAKAFGAPVAMLGGSGELVGEFRTNSGSLVHCSPPSAAAIAAAVRALDINRRRGDLLRRRLAASVVLFRRAVRDLLAIDNLFPVQPLQLPEGVDARAVHRALVARGVISVLHRESAAAGPRISFVLTARHRASEIERAARCLWAVLGQ